jgi:esterase/lipase superfamily enzyme
MSVRLLLLLVTLIVATPPSYGQLPSELELPATCQKEAAKDLKQIAKELPVLTARRQHLQREITRMAGVLESKDGRSQSNAASLRKRLGASQEALLRLIFQIECVNARLALEARKALPARAPPGTTGKSATGNVIEVTTFYATNRNWLNGANPASAYGASRAPTLGYGKALVTIPMVHALGEVERPSLFRLEWVADPRKHFVLKSVLPLDSEKVLGEVGNSLAASGSKAILLFVHGYNTDFSEAAMRTAQLAHDLDFPGVPIFFSWPSAGEVISYLKDLEAAQLSESAFNELLDDLSQLREADVFVIAHSMGSNLVSQALKSRVDAKRPTSQLTQLLLAAPDINADIFKTIIAPKLAGLQGVRTTVYASSSDLALRASKAVFGYTRLGETLGEVALLPGVETIDATSASLITRAFGHSYVTDSPAVLKDIEAIFRRKLPAKQRGLIEFGLPPRIYWKLPRSP